MLAALSGCQKEEEIFDNSRFYAYSTPISPFTATVVSYLQKQDDSTHLSVEISKRYGFPVWNKAQYVKSGNKVLLFVPLAKNEEKSVGGVWYFTQEGNSISYRVLGNNPSQAGFDQYFWMIDYFNQVLFANSVYQYKSPKPNGYLKAEASDCHIIIHCVNTYICDEFTGVHCWDEFDIIGDGSLGGGQGNDFIPPSGGPTTPADDPEPKVDTKRPLTPSEKQKVDQAKEEVDERGCGANMAYNMVNANWGNYKFVIDPNLNGKGLAAYYASSKTFGFLNENEITSKNITEEILHAAQDLIYENGTYQYSIVGSPNIEFEAKLLVEINNVVNGMCCSNAYLLQGENLIAFKEDIRGWIQNGNIDQNQYFHWLNIWYNDTDNPYYRKGIVKGDLSPMLLNKFLNEKLDCIKPVLQ